MAPRAVYRRKSQTENRPGHGSRNLQVQICIEVYGYAKAVRHARPYSENSPTSSSRRSMRAKQLPRVHTARTFQGVRTTKLFVFRPHRTAGFPNRSSAALCRTHGSVMMRPPDDTMDCSMDCTEHTITGQGRDRNENYSRADQSAIFPSSRA
ncbi:hypothetical protein CCYA_CCYA18G4509 [Cyanidiococcus yangmingshanensis]|nr:hypothetical protein CCYA_CCYA18G4509 [Cyanidiococcus yangmingshanensis]